MSRVEIRHAGKIGYHQPFPPPTRKWEVISMGFMFDLPTSNGLTGIMVIADKLSKRTHFIPVHSTNDAKDITEVFYKEIFKHHGLPRKIISDRDTRFTGTFWKELMKLLKVKVNLSTEFHPETDGQSERAFRTLQALRCYISYTQKYWYSYLPGLEFAYNNHVNDTTQQSPFFVEYGQKPFSIADTLLPDESSETTDIVMPHKDSSMTFNMLRRLRSHPSSLLMGQIVIMSMNIEDKSFMQLDIR